MNDYDDTPPPSPYRLLPLALVIVLVLACGVGGVVFLATQGGGDSPAVGGRGAFPGKATGKYPYPECNAVAEWLMVDIGGALEIVGWEGRQERPPFVFVTVKYTGKPPLPLPPHIGPMSGSEAYRRTAQQSVRAGLPTTSEFTLRDGKVVNKRDLP